MRTAPPTQPPPADLTARARIRDAAIDCFAREGFGASFATIATAAGVSPGLITHHFRSKAALRAVCDDEVIRRYRELKTAGLADVSGSLLGQLAHPEVTAPLLVYSLRAIQAGGDGARAFLDHLLEDARGVMAQSVAAGIVRPSRDEEARMRFLTFQSIGGLLVELLTAPAATPQEFVRAAMESSRRQTLPMLELFTEGLLTSRQMLNDYLDYVGDPPGDATPAGAATA